MAKINISDMMSKFNEMDELIKESETSLNEATGAQNVNMEPLILKSFDRWFNKESYVNLNSTYLKGHRTKVSEKNFIKMITALAPSITKDDILVLKDTTFAGADEGMIITSNKIYYKNSEGKGEIDIMNLESIYTKSAFFGNTVDITDIHGDVYHLGQISALKEELQALDEAFENLIDGVNDIRNGK